MIKEKSPETKLAFHNDQRLKDKYVDRVKAHQEADEIIQGIYWGNGKGCAVGCTMEHDNSGINIHQRMENDLGIPRMIARLEDRIFEGLTNEEAKKFPLRFLSAITPGADLSLVTAKFFVWLLSDPKDGIIKFARPDGKKAIEKVVELYIAKVAGKVITDDQWHSASTAAYSAASTAASTAAYSAAYSAYSAYSAAYSAYSAYSAAYSAYSAAYSAYSAYSAAYSAADSAAYSASTAADSAADSAAYSAYSASTAADSAARHLHYKKMANKLIELLKSSGVPKGVK